jgi:hypothetical protein
VGTSSVQENNGNQTKENKMRTFEELNTKLEGNETPDWRRSTDGVTIIQFDNGRIWPDYKLEVRTDKSVAVFERVTRK